MDQGISITIVLDTIARRSLRRLYYALLRMEGWSAIEAIGRTAVIGRAG